MPAINPEIARVNKIFLAREEKVMELINKKNGIAKLIEKLCMKNTGLYYLNLELIISRLLNLEYFYQFDSGRYIFCLLDCFKNCHPSFFSWSESLGNLLESECSLLKNVRYRPMVKVLIEEGVRRTLENNNSEKMERSLVCIIRNNIQNYNTAFPSDSAAILIDYSSEFLTIFNQSNKNRADFEWLKIFLVSKSDLEIIETLKLKNNITRPKWLQKYLLTELAVV